MGIQFRYEDLRVGKDILTLVDIVYEFTKRFPVEEKYELGRQMRRAATSIYLNLAEGSARKSFKDFARFITMAQGSLVETHACATLAQRRRYLAQEQVSELEVLSGTIWRQLSALHRSQTVS